MSITGDTNAIDIPQVLPSPRVPTTSFSPSASPLLHDRIQRKETLPAPRVLHPSDNDNLKLWLLENISPEAVKYFEAYGWEVVHSKKAMSEDELVAQIGNYHAIGIRSKTKITARVVKAAKHVRLHTFRVSNLLTYNWNALSFWSSAASASALIKST